MKRGSELLPCKGNTFKLYISNDLSATTAEEITHKEIFKVPLRRKFVGLFRPNSVAEYRVVSIFTQKTEQETVHPNIF